MTIDTDRITHPLRLAKGSHQPGSGKGCAMNVISYINGDVEITDFPSCSARPLARMVQVLNDRLAGPDGFLSPADSVVVLDLGWRTVGTADVATSVKWRWLADILVHPEHGVIRYALGDERAATIQRVAQLCTNEAEEHRVPTDEWRKARAAAYAAADADVVAAAAYAAADADVVAAAAYAAYAADAAYAAAADAAYAAYAAAADAAYAAYAAAARVKFTRWTIDHWRELAGLDAHVEIDHTAINNAFTRIGG